MIFYIIILVIFLLLSWLENHLKTVKINRVILLCAKILPFLILFIINAFKDTSVGVDTKAYQSWYDTVAAGGNPLGSYASVEIGFKTIMNIFISLGLPFRFFYIFCNLIIYTPICFAAIKLSKNVSLTALIYACIGALVINFSGLRQAMAMSLCFLSIYFLIKKRILTTLLFLTINIIAFTLHKSAIAFFIALPLIYIKITPKSLVFLTPFVILFFIALPSLFQFLQYSFIKNGAYLPMIREGVGEYYFIFYILFAIFLLFSEKNFISNFIVKKLTSISREKELNIDTFVPSPKKTDIFYLLIFFVGVLFQATSRISLAAPRFGTQFLIFASLFVPNFISTIKNKNVKQTLELLFGIAFILFFIYDVLIPNYLEILPYKFM